MESIGGTVFAKCVSNN